MRMISQASKGHERDLCMYKNIFMGEEEEEESSSQLPVHYK